MELMNVGSIPNSPGGVNDTGPMNWIDSFSLKIYILFFLKLQ